MNPIELLANRYNFHPDIYLEKIRSIPFAAFPNDPTEEQIQYLLSIAEKYNLNPLNREIIALPSSSGMGMLLVVTDLAWCRILSEHSDLAGVDFKFSNTWRSVSTYLGSFSCPESVECILRKKGEGNYHGTSFFLEYYRENSPLWNANSVSLLKQKALIACARLALGIVDIYDLDEAERILQTESSQKPESIVKPHQPLWPIRLVQEFCSDLQHYFGKPAGAQTFAVASIVVLYFFK